VANIFENKDRRVIPNWRSFKKTAVLGELDNNIGRVNKQPIRSLISIDEYIEDWSHNKTIPHAGDLLSSAIVNGIASNEHVLEAAQFILGNSVNSTLPQISLAKRFVTSNDKLLTDKLESITISEFSSLVDPKLIWNKIKEIKAAITGFPYNPIYYVELARNYSIVGQERKALRAMHIALNLSPDNRFILRCGSRLFAHYDEIDIAHDILRKTSLAVIDPWITSAEISLATLRGRSSRFLKKGFEMLNSSNFSSSNITELASAIGTVELIDGSLKKSKQFFKKSLLAPNDNSLAQIEWASSKEPSLRIDINEFHVKHNFEAQALENFHSNHLTECIDNTFRWFLDMPFSKRPVMLGAHIANSFLNNQETSRGFLKAGLISHPNDPQIVNNLVYSLALENKIEEAMKYMNLLVDNPTGAADITKICLKATRGLLCFRSGVPDMGRRLYLEAIEKSKEINNQYYNWLAILNYAREEILVKSNDIETIMETVARIPDNTSAGDVNKLKQEVVELHAKTKVAAK